MMSFTSEEAAQLLRNKFVIIMGDSNQRMVYKDLVLFLQKDTYLTNAQLRHKCEASFEGDRLLGSSELNNGTKFWESRQLCRPHHLLRFHFITRAYYTRMEGLLQELLTGPPPDVLVINSCLWDITRYGKHWRRDYSERLHQLFRRLCQTLPSHCLVIWSLALPPGNRVKGGFLGPQPLERSLWSEVLEANLRAAILADQHHLDVLDLHFHFRRRPQLRASDGVHWNQRAHRTLTQTLLQHIAQAWGVRVPGRPPTDSRLREVGGRDCVVLGQSSPVLTHLSPEWSEPSPGLARGPPQLTGWPAWDVDRESPHHVWRLVHHGLVARRRLSHRHVQPYRRDPQRRGRERLGPEWRGGDGSDGHCGLGPEWGGRNGQEGPEWRGGGGSDGQGPEWRGGDGQENHCERREPDRPGLDRQEGHCWQGTEWRGGGESDGHCGLWPEWRGGGGSDGQGPEWRGGDRQEIHCEWREQVSQCILGLEWLSQEEKGQDVPEWRGPDRPGLEGHCGQGPEWRGRVGQEGPEWRGRDRQEGPEWEGRDRQEVYCEWRGRDRQEVYCEWRGRDVSNGQCERRGRHGLDGHFVLGREWGGQGQEGPEWGRRDRQEGHCGLDGMF
ncbi:uncharacterized protein LOC116989454 [Amblyraja radiata]|uniref:uncharacterized protein LOC116989454 n=1 Tax=Amblyraja radiata TaxID=386614 RepID=UPI001402899E|nr:uncharacterized protein LOC116989454 [Amblyraja radiata]